MGTSEDFDMAKRLVRPKEVQKRLGIGQTKFFEMVKRGELRLVRLGPKNIAVIEDELDALIDALPDAYPRATAHNTEPAE
jgi:excisionase family DNA binding protein